MGKLASPSGYKDAHHATPGIRRVQGKFTTNNTSSPAASTVFGQGFTVARTGVGTFVVTFLRGYKIALFADARAISAANLVSVTAFTPGTIRTGASMTIVVQSAINTAAETTGVVVMFEAVFQNITGQKGK